MDSKKGDTLDTVMYSRLDVAFERLERNTKYTELYNQQQEEEKRLKEAAKRGSAEEFAALIRYIEGRTEQEFFELKAAYLQGMRDGVKAFRAFAKLMA